VVIIHNTAELLERIVITSVGVSEDNPDANNVINKSPIEQKVTRESVQEGFLM
jgi:hypothetical protein